MGPAVSERYEIVSSASVAVKKGGGWIEDILFSNVAVNLRCVVMAAAIARSMEEITTISFGFTPDHMAALQRAATGSSDDEELRFSYSFFCPSRTGSAQAHSERAGSSD